MLIEQHYDWVEGRSYLGLDVLARSRITLVDTATDATEREVTTPTALTAWSAATGSRGAPFIHHDRGVDPNVTIIERL